MSEPISARDFGRLEAEVESLKRDVTEMKAMVASMHSTISEAKGGWKVLVGVGTASAAITAGLMKLMGVFLR